jgi:phosphoglycerate kinase
VTISRIEAAKPFIDDLSARRKVIWCTLEDQKVWRKALIEAHFENNIKSSWYPSSVCFWLRGEEAENAAANLKAGEVLFRKSSLSYRRRSRRCYFAKELASLGDIYVNDALNCSQSACFQPPLLPSFESKKCFGLLLAKEIESLNKVLKNSENR